jgi:hypothetical protein
MKAKPKKKLVRPRGRPTVFDQKIADKICARLSDGESLREICRTEAYPGESTVRRWAADDASNFAAQYARAREIGYDRLAEELVEIADTPLLGVKTKTNEKGETETTEGDMIEHRRLQVDVRKWMLAKMLPKKYGDRLAAEVTGKDGAPLVPEMSPADIARRIAFTLAQGLAATTKG